MKVDGIEIVIESNATKACAELDRMIAKLNKVNASILFTGKAGKGSSVRGLTSGLKSYTTSASKATKSTASLAAMFGKFYASCFLAIRGVKALGRAIESSMDYIETYNYYNVIMDKIGTEFGDAWKENGYNSADEYAKSFKQRLNALTGEMTGFKIGEEGGLYSSNSIGLGLDPEKIMGFQAEVSSITNAVGLMGETSLNTSKALTMLSADMSSLKNVDIETVMTNFQSGLIGQSRALYKYGIDITNNTLAEYALANGISKKVSEMTQAEKMQLRMIAILDQSKVAYGDMANTINGVANQYRIFKQQVSNLARIIGNLFIPVLQKVLPYVNGFIIALQRLFTWVGNLLGVDWSKMMDGISSGYTDTGLEALGDSADDTTDSLENANKAAKKLKKTIFGYDQLNIAQDNTEDTGTGTNVGGGGIDLSGAIADALGDYESIWDKAMKDMENKASAIADKIVSAFNRMWDSIEPFRTALKKLWDEGLSKLSNFSFTALKDFYEQVLKPLGEWAFGTEDEGLTKFVDVLNDMLNAIDWDNLNSSLKDLFKALEPFAENIGNGLNWLWENVLSKMIVAQVNGILISFINALGDALTSLNIIIDKISPALQWLWDKIGTKWRTNYISEMGDSVSKLLAPFTALKNLLEGFSWDTVIGYLKSVWEFAKIISNPFMAFLEFMGNVFLNTLNAIFGDLKTSVEKWLADWGLSMYSKAPQFVKDGVVEIVRTFATLPNRIGLELNTLHNRMIIAFTNIKNGILEIWNTLINAIKSMNIPTPHFSSDGKSTFSIGGFDTKLPKFKVDWYATGGFPEDGLFMANHNELVGKFSNGKTAVANNEQITDGIKQAVIEGMMEVTMAASNSNNTSQNDDRTPIVMDGRVVAEITYKNFIAMQRQGLMPKLI